MRNKGAWPLLAAAMVQAGCAADPDKIEARYVSPTVYRDWSCEQVMEERRRVASEASRVAGLQQENANGDAALMTVGLILFWPALIGLAATKDRTDELARLKGENDALDQTARQNRCTLPPPANMAGTPAATVRTPPATAATPADYRCPSGYRVTTDIGTTMVWQGDAPGRLGACQVNREAMWLGIYAASDATAGVGRMLNRMLPLEPGRSATETVTSPGNGAFHKITARVVRSDRVDVPAGSFDAVLVRVTTEAQAGGSHHSYVDTWVDTASFLPVKRTATLVSGQFSAPTPNWEATAVQRDQAAAR